MYRYRPSSSALHTLASVKRLYEDGLLGKAIQVAEELHSVESAASIEMLYLLLQGCISNKDLPSGRRVHRLIEDCGFAKNAFLGTHLMRLFVLCGSFVEATHVFEKIPRHTVFTWNAYIAACTLSGNALQALDVYQAMQLLYDVPDQHIFASALKACAKTKSLNGGRLIHYQIMASLSASTYIENSLIDMYVKCHALGDALSVFERMNSSDVVTWTAIIIGCGEVENGLDAVRYFKQMLCIGIFPNEVTYIGIFKACSNSALQNQGLFFHACIINGKVQIDLTLGNTLLAMYARSRRMKHAVAVLDWMQEQDIVTFNLLIAACVQQRYGLGAVCAYQKLRERGLQPDNLTFISILKGCSCTGSLENGRVIHMDIVEHTPQLTGSVNNALVGMYGETGSIADALCVFRSFPEHDTVSWNSLIASYIQQRQYVEAFRAYNHMQEKGVEADQVTFVSILEACSSLASLVFGMLMHTCILLAGISVDFYLQSCLVDMYYKCDSSEDASKVSEKALQNEIMWTNAPTYDNVYEEDEDILSLALNESPVTFITSFTKLLKACSLLNALDLGRRAHCCVAEGFCEVDIHIGNSLVDMYAKCGSPEDALGVLRNVQNRDAVTWSALISGCCHWANFQFASQCFEKMKKEGVAPVEITYVCLLTASSRVGSWEEGCQHFESMINHYALSLAPEHYYCMVDLLGRSGKLIEADDVLRTIPLYSPGVVGQRTLLTHYRLHRNQDLGYQGKAF